MLAHRGLLLPTFQQGFARSAGESAYPELWQGLANYWAPSLGPQGLTTLSDWGGRKTHCSLTSIVGDNWVQGVGGWALDLDGTNDFASVTLTDGPLIEGPVTMAIWVQPDTTSTRLIAFSIPLSDSGTAGNSIDLEINEVSPLTFCYAAVKWGGTVYVNSGVAPVAGQRQHLGYTRDGSTHKIYIDGRLRATATDSAQSGTATRCRIGSFNSPFPDPKWNGKLGDAGLWKRVLSDAEMMQLALGASPLTLSRRRLSRVPASGIPRHFIHYARMRSA